MLDEEKETRKAIEEIIERYPDLDQYLAWKNKTKSETLLRNVTRVEVAVQQLTRSRNKVEFKCNQTLLYVRLRRAECPE